MLKRLHSYLSARSNLGYKLLIAVAIFAGGALAGWLLNDANAPDPFNVVRYESGNHAFIAPILYTTVPESTDPKYLVAKNALTRVVSDAEWDGRASAVSIYFRDLDESQWVGIDESEKFSAASMLKVVTLLAVLKESETDQGLLNRKLIGTYASGEQPLAQDFYPPENPVVEGRVYTVNELLSHLIIESDNTANDMLTSLVGKKRVDEAFTDMRLPNPATTTDVDSAQEYSHLFRVLYNASYVSDEFSEQALDLLSRTTFRSGLVAGVPEDVKVSHKFGERSETEGSLHELHDCGIIYYPGHPYFLCVMTRGTDFPTLAKVIAAVSTEAWEQMQRLHPR